LRINLGTGSAIAKHIGRRRRLLEIRWGTYEASYNNLPALLNTIVVLNPGTYYDIKTYPLIARLGKLVLQ
jgi:hypothetical protein